MDCAYPRLFNGIKCPCGQCMPCRINNRRLWTGRIIMETYSHEQSIFITLTYDSTHLPENASVSKREAQLFLKRVRKHLGPRKIRYFFVGEYGHKSNRPHYHAIVFGLGLEHTHIIERSWDKGFVHVGEVTPQSASYVCGYCCKKLTKADDSRLVSGQEPEFSLKSKGLGKAFVEAVSQELKSRNITTLPKVVRIGGKFWALGRYLRKVLVETLHLDNVWLEHLEALRQEVRDLSFSIIGITEDTKAVLSQQMRYVRINKLWQKVPVTSAPVEYCINLEKFWANPALQHNCEVQYKNSLQRKLL